MSSPCINCGHGPVDEYGVKCGTPFGEMFMDLCEECLRFAVVSDTEDRDDTE